MKPRVIMTVGAPGSGKTTLARSLDPKDWAVLSFDDFRAAMWRTKKTFHGLVDDAKSPLSQAMQEALHETYFRAMKACITAGLNVCMANTHLERRRFDRCLGYLRREGITPELIVFANLSFAELQERNATRPEADRVSIEYLSMCFDQLHAHDAWWKSWHGPMEIVRHQELRHAA